MKHLFDKQPRDAAPILLRQGGAPQRRMALRFCSLGLAALLLAGLLPPVPAGAAPSLKEEVVYVRLLNDGSVDEIYVVNSFALDGDGQITDYGNYAYVQNLSNTDTLSLKDGVVTIDTKGDRLYYEGFLMDAELPWVFTITYKLDGMAVAPEDLGGMSGFLEMEISTRHNPRGSLDFYDRYCLQIAVSLDSGICRNISADGGTVAAAGGSKQINFIVLPGRETGLTLTADVEDFKMPAITIAGVTMNMGLDFDDVDMADIRELIDGLIELDDGVKELLDGIFDMYDGVVELYDGMMEFADGVVELDDGVKELADGTEELKDGVAELADGTEELVDGVEDLVDGVAEMAEGMDEMLEGVEELAEGVEEFDDGIIELCDGIDELYDGAKKLADGMFELAGGFGGVVRGGKEIGAGLADYAEGSGLIAAGGGSLYMGFEQYFNDVIFGMVNAQLVGTGFPDALLPLNRLNYIGNFAVIGINEYSDPLGENPLASLFWMLSHYDDLLSGLGLYVGGVDLLATNADKTADGMSTFVKGLSQYQYGLDEYMAGVEEYRDGVGKLADGAKELRDGSRELLDGVIELRDGVAEFRDGVVELHDGVIELYDGIVELHDGVVELRDGVI
ncbi:MAG: hypothetical protein FWG28_07910, partial [Clostridiales bacterium]|nr:hypothetical protein [Clostridiales bacterium]